MHFEVVAVGVFASHVIVLLSNKDNAATSMDTTEREKHTGGGRYYVPSAVPTVLHTLFL